MNHAENKNVAVMPYAPSRRQFVGGMAAGLLGGMAMPAFAQGASGASGAGARNPRDPNVVPDYPEPPFDKQRQDWPGLASEMNPPPDHGEKTYQGSGRLKGRRALITGGDSGMGRAAAIAFAREGADVAINYLPAEESDAQAVVKLIEAEGRKAVTIPGDIRNESFCQELVAQAANRLGGLDILVNNAARQHAVDSIADLTTEQFDWTMRTNLYATFWITKAALPHLPRHSAIINTASVVAYQPPKNLLDYSETKAALIVFTQVLAKQLADKGIRVNAVAPGPIWTPLQVTGGQPQDKIPQFGADVAMGRPGQPAELAGIYVLLASNENSYATGQVYGAQGGRG